MNSGLWLNGKFPATVLGFLLVQTVTGIWWLSGFSSTVTSRLDSQGEALKEVKVTVTALTSAKVVVLEAEVSRLQAELAIARLQAQQRRPQ